MEEIAAVGKKPTQVDLKALQDIYGPPPEGISPAVWFAIILQMINIIKALISAIRNEPPAV